MDIIQDFFVPEIQNTTLEMLLHVSSILRLKPSGFLVDFDLVIRPPPKKREKK